MASSSNPASNDAAAGSNPASTAADTVPIQAPDVPTLFATVQTAADAVIRQQREVTTVQDELNAFVIPPGGNNSNLRTALAQEQDTLGNLINERAVALRNLIEGAVQAVEQQSAVVRRLQLQLRQFDRTNPALPSRPIESALAAEVATLTRLTGDRETYLYNQANWAVQRQRDIVAGVQDQLDTFERDYRSDPVFSSDLIETALAEETARLERLIQERDSHLQPSPSEALEDQRAVVQSLEEQLANVPDDSIFDGRLIEEALAIENVNLDAAIARRIEEQRTRVQNVQTQLDGFDRSDPVLSSSLIEHALAEERGILDTLIAERDARQGPPENLEAEDEQPQGNSSAGATTRSSVPVEAEDEQPQDNSSTGATIGSDEFTYGDENSEDLIDWRTDDGDDELDDATRMELFDGDNDDDETGSGPMDIESEDEGYVQRGSENSVDTNEIEIMESLIIDNPASTSTAPNAGNIDSNGMYDPAGSENSVDTNEIEIMESLIYDNPASASPNAGATSGVSPNLDENGLYIENGSENDVDENEIEIMESLIFEPNAGATSSSSTGSLDCEEALAAPNAEIERLRRALATRISPAVSEDCEEDLAEANANLERVRRDLATRTAELEQLRRDLATRTGSSVVSEDCEEDLAEANANLEKLRRDLATRTAERNGAQQRIRILDEDIADRESRELQVREELRLAREEPIDEELQTATATAETAEARVVVLQLNLATVTADRNIARASVEGLEAEVERLKAQLETLTSENNSGNQSAQCEAACQKANEEKKAAEDRAEELTRHNENLTAAAEAADERAVDLRQELGATNLEVLEAQRSLNENIEELNTVREQRDAALLDLSNATRDLAAAREETGRTANVLNTMTQEYRRVQASLRAVTEERDEAQQSLADEQELARYYQNELELTGNEIRRRSIDAAALRNEIQDLEAAGNNLRTLLSENSNAGEESQGGNSPLSPVEPSMFVNNTPVTAGFPDVEQPQPQPKPKSKAAKATKTAKPQKVLRLGTRRSTRATLNPAPSYTDPPSPTESKMEAFILKRKAPGDEKEGPRKKRRS